VTAIVNCRRCDELRQQLLIVRASPAGKAAWQCPECSEAWTPVTFAPTLAGPERSHLDSVALPTLCNCAGGGPFILTRLRSRLAWIWLCAACGTGQKATIAE
jgi:hypothetical protein